VTTMIRLPRHQRALWMHVTLLFAGLVAAALLVDVRRGAFDADEGALLSQVQVLHRHGEWFGPYPLAELDRDGAFTPILYSAHRGDEFAPFPLRPGLVGLTLAGWSVGGALGATVPGIAGIVVASLVAADLAARLDPRSRWIAFWVAGLASPLSFHALSLRGHGPTVGLVALSLWCVARAQSPARGSPTWPIIGAAVTAFLAALLRREALIFALAVCAGSAVIALQKRDIRFGLSAGAMLIGTAGGLVVDQLLSRGVFDAEYRPAPGSGGGSFIEARLHAIVRFIEPGYSADPVLPRLLAFVAMTLVLAAAVRFRRSRDPLDLSVLLGGAALAALARLAMANRYMVMGLIPAFPVGVLGFAVVARRTRDPLFTLLTTTTLVCVGLVAATQYPFGGGFEWGTRYAAVALVSGIPVASVGLVAIWDRLEHSPPHRRIVTAAIIVLALAPATMGLIAQQHARATNATNHEAGHELARALDVDLIVSTHPQIPRTVTDHFDREARWIRAWPEELDRLLPVLEEAGYQQVAVFTLDAARTSERAAEQGWALIDQRVGDENPGSVTLGVLIRDLD
jgi:hypothetical protein